PRSAARKMPPSLTAASIARRTVTGGLSGSAATAGGAVGWPRAGDPSRDDGCAATPAGEPGSWPGGAGVPGREEVGTPLLHAARKSAIAGNQKIREGLKLIVDHPGFRWDCGALSTWSSMLHHWQTMAGRPWLRWSSEQGPGGTTAARLH